MPLRLASICLPRNCSAALVRPSWAKFPTFRTCNSVCKFGSPSWSAERSSCFSSSTSSGATASAIPSSTLSARSPAINGLKAKKAGIGPPFSNSLLWELLDADQIDQAQHFTFRDVIERASIFFFEAFAQIFRGDKTCFAVGQVTPRLLAQFHERSMREPHHVRLAINKEFRVDGVRVPRGDAVPQMRKPALIGLPAQLRSHLKRADELAHRAGIGKYGACCHVVSFVNILLNICAEMLRAFTMTDQMFDAGS